MTNFLLRAVLLLVGLLFAASLALAVLLLVAVWMARATWARLTGQPVRPWVMRYDPRAGFERFRAAAERSAEPSASDVANARACGESARASVPRGDVGDVTDVRARPVSRAE